MSSLPPEIVNLIMSYLPDPEVSKKTSARIESNKL